MDQIVSLWIHVLNDSITLEHAKILICWGLSAIIQVPEPNMKLCALANLVFGV